MKHIQISPVQAHRSKLASSGNAATKVDPRWYALDLVRVSRLRLKLTDRDIAVLRGLLSLLPTDAWGRQMVVFASNRVLAARCDGIEERTLRRRLNQLVERGLIARKTSPNGKRYQVKDPDNACVLAYGIDLAPLYGILAHLEALALDCRREERRIRGLKSLIRDRLYNHAGLGALPCAQTAHRALRRKVSADDLQTIFDEMQHFIETSQPLQVTALVPETEKMPATDSQNVRHIQRSNIEDLESESAEDRAESSVETVTVPKHEASRDITVSECMEAATTARAMSARLPRTWPEVVMLARTLGPSIGLDPASIRAADMKLGEYGSALAILGLVEAFDRIRSPKAYLNTLVKKAQTRGLDCVKMFWSLTRRAQGTYA
jgi:replication initiation protein RepC